MQSLLPRSVAVAYYRAWGALFVAFQFRDRTGNFGGALGQYAEQRAGHCIAAAAQGKLGGATRLPADP